MSDERIYDDYPLSQPLEVQVKPKWPASFVLKWLAAGVAYGLLMGLVALGVGSVVTAYSDGSLWPIGFAVAGYLFVICLPIPLMSEMSYREQNIKKRYTVVRKESE